MHAGPGAGHVVAQNPGTVVMGPDIGGQIRQHHRRRIAGFIAGPFETLDMDGKGLGALSNLFRSDLDALGQ